MKRPVPAWLLQLVWFGAGVFGTGAVWFFLSRGDKVSAGMSAVAAGLLTVVAVQLHRLNDREQRFQDRRERLARFLEEGNTLLRRSNEDPPPVLDSDAWVARVESYLMNNLDSSYVARLGNFSGLTFHGDGSAKSGFRKAVEGRCMRLQTFISEFRE